MPSPVSARIIGRSAETSVGREAASQVEQIFVVDADPAAVARVRQIGRRLAASAKDPDFPFEFHVVEDREINAFALPGGFVYVFRGLLQLVPNDDALAFVLAHEVSHVTEHHAIRQFEKNLLLNAGITAVLAGTGARGAGRAADIVQVLAALSFTRHDEAAADARGIDLMTVAGYNPRAAVEAMALVKRAGGGEKGMPALLRTHPAPESRMKRLGQLADELLEKRRVERAEARALPAAPPVVKPRIAGLDQYSLRLCEWFPLASGAKWLYRLKGEGAEATLVVRALEKLEAEPAGVYRLEYDLGRGVKTTRLLAPAGEELLSRGESAGAWSVDAVFAPARLERVRVPAGEFEAAKVERLGGDGSVQSTAWYARGVGLVKKVSHATGCTQELTSYTIPK